MTHATIKLSGFIPAVLFATLSGPTACGDDEFNSCASLGTCPPGDAGEAGGGMETGGTSGSGATGNSGEGGAATGGRTGGTGGIAGDVTGGTAGEDGTGGIAGDGGSGDQGGEGGMGPGPDTTQPTIVSVSPADSATGVRGDANIVVTFSEPMDRVTTQAAYQSADISGVTFSWSDESTVLTVNPNSDLAYVAGDLAVTAQAFAVTITDTAEDSAGNRLAGDFGWSFRTLRRITQTFATGETTRAIYSDGRHDPAECPSYVFGIGDYQDNYGSLRLISRDIAGLPDGIVAWESATLSGNQWGAEQSTYDALGSLLAYHMNIHPPSAATWSSPHLRELGPFSTDATLGTKSVDVLEALADDYEHRAERMQASQYKLMFAQVTDNDGRADYVQFDCRSVVLTARYLIP